MVLSANSNRIKLETCRDLICTDFICVAIYLTYRRHVSTSNIGSNAQIYRLVKVLDANNVCAFIRKDTANKYALLNTNH